MVDAEMNYIAKFFIWLFCVLILLVAVFFSGYYYGGKTVEPGVIYRDKIITTTIYRDYPGMGRAECIDKLMCYDTREPMLDIQHIEGVQYRLSAGLCDRSWKRDVSIEAGRSGNWKFLVSGGILAGAIGAYMILR
jgi:hypothetical protein